MYAEKIEAMPSHLPLNSHERDQEYEKDVWQLNIVGIKPPPYIMKRSLSFKSIQPVWLRHIAKQFLRFQSATKAFYTIEQYLRSIVHFYLPRPTILLGCI